MASPAGSPVATVAEGSPPRVAGKPPRPLSGAGAAADAAAAGGVVSRESMSRMEDLLPAGGFWVGAREATGSDARVGVESAAAGATTPRPLARLGPAAGSATTKA